MYIHTCFSLMVSFLPLISAFSWARSCRTHTQRRMTNTKCSSISGARLVNLQQHICPCQHLVASSGLLCAPTVGLTPLSLRGPLEMRSLSCPAQSTQNMYIWKVCIHTFCCLSNRLSSCYNCFSVLLKFTVARTIVTISVFGAFDFINYCRIMYITPCQVKFLFSTNYVSMNMLELPEIVLRNCLNILM